jgi:hypothetical protein
VHFDVEEVRLPSGRVAWRGKVTLPFQSPLMGRQLVSTQSVGPTKASAVSKAAALASGLIDNPVAMAMLPPGAPVALQGLKLLADEGPAALKRFAGPARDRVASVLRSIF